MKNLDKNPDCLIFIPKFPGQTLASLDEERLMVDLFRGYNNLVRPVENTSSRPLEVHFSLALVLLISVVSFKVLRKYDN